MSSSKKPIGIILILVLLLVVAGIAGYFYSMKESSEDVIDIDLTSTETPLEAGQSTPVPDVGRRADTVKPLAIQEHLGRRGVGDPNAPVKVQEFFSLTCNHCASFYQETYQELKEKYIDTGKIYFIYEEFPLNGPALYGSMIARCLPEDRYVSFIGLLLTTQEKWAFGGDFKTSLQKDAALAGLSAEEFETCFNDKAMQEEIANNIKTVNEMWKVQSTPTFVFNDGEVILDGGHELVSFDQVYSKLTGDTASAAAKPAPAAETTEEPVVTPEPIAAETEETAPAEESSEETPLEE